MTTAKLDPETGLPELPEGFFWRVTKPDIIGYNELHIRRRILGFFSVKIAYGFIHGAVSERTVLNKALDILQRLTPAQQYKLFGVPLPTNLVGDYPPRKLGS